MVTTAFGKAEIAEQVTLKQRVNGKQFSTLVQLLEDDRGEWLIRFAYATDGVAMYGGGQFELGIGRVQIQELASLFHADMPNDVAPSAFNQPEIPEGVPEPPLPPPQAFGSKS